MRSLLSSPSLFILAMSVLGIVGCAETQPVVDRSRPRLVVWLGVCTLNKEYLQPYNPKVSFTPELEALAKKSTVFRRHRTEAGMSGIAFASMLCGVDARKHGVFTHPRRLDDSLYDITEAFRDNGYEPHFFDGQRMASHDLNYAQGVDPNNVYHVQGVEPDKFYDQPFDVAMLRILTQLKRDPEKRAAVIANFTVTHGPYATHFVAEVCKKIPP